ncbi:alpha/beta hydrolase [Lysinimonas soli]|uniref:Alpha/beta hydrolase n=1 Tax=Lysinimonas soli TaxID=1074233 RepID=A0ABW0NTU0_9MICO
MIRSSRPTRRLIGAVATVAVVTLLLSGCVSWFRAPTATSSTSTPTGEKVAADLQSFYSQVLTWKSCSGSFQCATVTAPMTWKTPGQASIKLALIRKQATGTKLGSLLVNPGGPGASGVDFVRDNLDYATDKTLQANYDIVGFDPRGVGRSSAVNCGGATVLDHYNYDIVPGQVGSDAWIANLEQENAAFGADCLKGTGALLQYVDTVSAARDLDLLRAVLGDTKLNYLGYSYGTFLGATYAELYPTKTGRLVLDGALDPATTDFEVTDVQAKGFESAFRAYLKNCIGQKDCPFHGTVDQAMTETGQILDQLEASPLRNSDGRLLGANTMFVAIILPLYSKDNWPYLNTLFSEVRKGVTTTAFALADSYNDRSQNGSYNSNSTEAFVSINCLDYASDSSIASMRTEAAQLAKDAPIFGPRMAYGGTSCAKWPFQSTRVRGPIEAKGSGDILVVGTTNDPATPYVWAKNLAGELDRGHLVTYHGEGHTAYNKSNSCVNNTVDDYFVKGTVPSKDPEC